MPGGKMIFQSDCRSCAKTINGNERSEQKPGVDKSPLRYGTVYNLDYPAHEGVERKKHYIEKYTYTNVQYYMFPCLIPLLRDER